MIRVSRPSMAIIFVLLPCIFISQSDAQTSRKCLAIRSAEHELEYASLALAKCASTYDPSDSCDSDFNDVRDAHDTLEDKISDADSDCE